jgi:hypothetical protein
VPSLRPWLDGVLRFGPHTSATPFAFATNLNEGHRLDELFRGLASPSGIAPFLAADVADLDAGLDPPAYVARVQGFADVQDRDGAIARLYQALLDRTPDQFGYSYWRLRLQFGEVDLARIARSLARSIEFRMRYGALGDRAYVAQLYENVLGREGDADGVDFWTGRLGAGGSRADVALHLGLSPENRARSQAVVDVDLAYLNLLKRAPTDAAIGIWRVRPLADLTRMLLHCFTYARLSPMEATPGFSAAGGGHAHSATTAGA